MTSKICGIDHLGVAVFDLDQAVATYCDQLGLTQEGGETLPERGIKVSFVGTGDSRIELLAATRDNSEISKFLETRGEGIHHVCLRTDNIKETLEHMKARGAKLIDTTPRPGAHGTKVAFVHPKGAHGVLIEIVEKKASASS